MRDWSDGLGGSVLSESELYKELVILTKDKDRWEGSIPYVSSLLTYESVKIQAKALWLLGEMGLVYPAAVQDAVPAIASFCDSPVPLLRERTVNALGRIGRGSFPLIEPYWTGLFRFASDEDAKVRLSFIWASENVAANTPGIYEEHMPVFEAYRQQIDFFEENGYSKAKEKIVVHSADIMCKHIRIAKSRSNHRRCRMFGSFHVKI